MLTAPENPEARELWTEIARRLKPEDRPDPGRALAQARRLEKLAERWEWAHTETTRGLEEAAGLDTLRPSRAAALSSLARYVALRVPPECDPATFFAYAAGEQTPVAWLPLVRPLYHRAIADAAGRAALAATAEHLARRLLVPVRPGDDESAISQTVLGVVKAAEYLGVRWHTRPEQAAEYAALLTECYGPDHDAYRPVFAVPRRSLSVAGVRRAGSSRT